MISHTVQTSAHIPRVTIHIRSTVMALSLSQHTAVPVPYSTQEHAALQRWIIVPFAKVRREDEQEHRNRCCQSTRGRKAMN